MDPSTVFLISALVGSILATLGFIVGALLARHSVKDQEDERYRQGYAAGQRIGWYDAADELKQVADDLTSQGYAHRAAIVRSVQRYLNEYFDGVDGVQP